MGDNTLLENFSSLPQLTLFRISYSNLSKVPTDLPRKMPSLTWLSFLTTDISVLESKQFVGLDQLVNLHIERGKLKIIRDGAFSALRKMKELRLLGNELTTLSTKTFNGIEKLEKLDVGYNKITTIQDSAFYNLKRLTEIQLSNNKIKYFSTFQSPKALSQGSLNKTILPSLRLLDLDDNPLDCDCELYKLIERIGNKKQNVDLYGSCKTPAPLAGLTINNYLRIKESQCTICDLSLPCLNNAQCIPHNKTNFSCNCTQNYMGDKCETKVNMSLSTLVIVVILVFFIYWYICHKRRVIAA